MMKKIWAIIIALFISGLALFHLAGAGENSNTGLEKDLKILYTSDVHCAIDQG